MSRLVILTLIVSLGNASVAFAGETLLSVATRVAREAARNQRGLDVKSAPATPVQKNWAKSSSSALAQEQPALSTSGMSKRTKVLIYLAAAVGVVATWYTIDQKVEDNTPSSLGLRED